MIEILNADAQVVSDALTTLWHRAPARRREIEGLVARAPGLWIEGEDADEDPAS